MKSVKWMYVSAMAIAFGMLSFATVACHDDDDDPKPAEGEVIETPKPVVEYYIKGAVTVKGEGKSGVKVKVGDKDCITDSKGEFSVTESNTGTYEVSVAPNGYLSQKTSVKIADNAENRSVVKVAFALTEVSPVKEVVLDEMTDPITVEDESTSNEAIPTTTEDFGQVEPDKVVEDMPLAKVEIVIPAGVIKEDAQEDPTLVKNGKVDISVTTFVPAPKEVVTEVKPTEVVEAVKSIPLAAAQFQPTGLQFSEPVNISIPNPIPGLTFADDMVLTYLENGKWVPQTEDINKVVYDEKSGSYTTKVKHFSSYAMENKVTSKVSTENVVKSEILGQASRDNSENPKAVTGIALTYKEKSGWECKDADIKAAVEKALSGAKPETVNAMVAFFKTRLYSLMGSASGITETTRTYNTVNVNGYTTMTYTCYAKTRTTTLSTTVKYNNKDVKISVIATRYTGTDHQYKTVTTNPTHSGGKGGSN